MEMQKKSISRRDFLRLATLSAAGAVLAACAKSQATPGTTEVQGAPTSEGGKTVRMGVWASPEEFSFFQDWVKPFEDKTGTTVNIEYVDWTTYWTKLPTQFSAGTAADVLEMSNYTLQFGPQNVLADQNSYFESAGLKKDDFVAVPFEKFTYEGKLLSFPMCLTIQMLAYNQDVFDKASEPYPDNTWDWNKMVEVAQKFTLDANGKGPMDAGFDAANVVQWGIEMALDEESGWSALVYQNGSDYWKDNYTTPNFTDPKVEEAFQFLSDMINHYMIAPSPAAQQKFSGSAFQAGQAAMSRQGTYMLLPYLTNIQSFKWDVTVPPKGETRGVMADGIGWSMAESSKIKDDAFSLIKFFNTDGQEYMGSRHWAVPILKSAYGSFAAPPPEHAGDLSEEFDYGHRWPAYKNQQQVDDFIGQKTTEIFNGTVPVSQGLQEIQDFVGPLVK
jgi:multiple sugar transport system substrate-binding protein